MAEVTVSEGVDPVEYVKSYFTILKEKDISVLIGTIILLKDVKFKLLQNLLNLRKSEVEEAIGRLLQTDLLQGEFTRNSFVLKKINYKIKQQSPNLILDERILLAYLKARGTVSYEEIQKAFSLGYEAVLHIISSFVSRGLISGKIKGEKEITVSMHYHLPLKKFEDITVQEKKIAGYAMLRGITTVSEITSDLLIPEHKIQSVLVDMILSNIIKCVFSVRKNFLQGYSLHIEIQRFLIQFPQRNIEIMTSDERLLIGLVSLRKKISLSELVASVGLPRETVISILSILTSTDEFRFSITENNIVSPSLVPQFPVSKHIDELSIRSLFNYRVLYGMISTQRQIKISQVANKMKIQDNEVLRGIVDLYLSGLVVGWLQNFSTFHIEQVRKPEKRSELALEMWERIILGALISEGVISWPKIAALLEIDRDTAREKAYAFIARGIANTIAKDSVVTLREIPRLPPLTQITDLSQVEQPVFGYLVAHKNASLKEIRSIFSMSAIQVYRKVYLLCGSGLLLVQRNKGVFKTSQPRIPEPVIPIRELDLNYQLVVSGIELSKGIPSKISIKKLANHVKLHNYEVVKLISGLIAQGYYRGQISSKHFVKTHAMFKIREPPKCFSCGVLLQDYKKPCPSCNAVPPICSVCKGAMSSADDLVACPHCRHEAHPLHIKEWLKIKGECPVCRNKLRSDQLINIEY
jgi:predicted transcriptional regulator